MIAKIMCLGKDRGEALARLRRALAETAVQVERGATNKSLLARILAHPDFVSGNITTRWLDRERSAGTFDDAPFAGEALLVGAVLAYGVEAASALAAFQAAVARGVPQSFPDAAGREVSLEVRGARATLRVLAVGHAEYRVRVNGLEWAVVLTDDGAGSARVELGGRSLRVFYEVTDSEIALEVEGSTHRVRRDGGGMVRAPAPCLVIDIPVKEGDLVKVGDRLASVEAMKMEMPIIARAAGKVTKILATANTHAAAGAPLLVVSPVTEGAGEETAVREPPKPAAAPAADRLEALIDENGKLRADVLEGTHLAGRKGIAEALRAELTRVFCGFDADDGVLDRLQAIIGSSRWASLKHPASYADLARALVVFVDVERLFSSSLLPASGPGPALSMQMGFYAYCRRMKSGTTGAPAELVAALTKTLAHYGISEFTANERLAQTLLRLTMAHGGPEARVAKVNQLASSLLKVLMHLHQAGADFSRVDGLEAALAELPVVVARKYVFVADNAYQARYMLFQQSRFERRPAERVTFVADALVHLGSLPKNAQAGAARELARTREPIAAALALASWNKDASVRRWALEVLYRRLYDVADDVGIEVQRPRSAPTAALLTAVSAGQSTPPRLLCACDQDGLAQALKAVATAGDALQAANVEADLVVQHAKLDDIAMPELLKEAFGAGGPVRLTLIAMAGDELRYRTFTRDQAYAGAEPWGALHPEAARRMELWRLGAFELTEVSAQENLVVYHGRARSNPKDQRLFALGEIRHVPEGAVRADDGGLTVFDYAYFEAVRALREAQGRRTVRERLYGNRIILHLGPVLVAKRGDFMKVAEQLSAHRAGLGLESVTVRARMAQSGAYAAGPVDTEIHVYNPTGHKLEVKVDRPSSEPIAAATEYELKLQRARALDMAYPYEVIRMLTSDDKVMAEAHFPPGRFVEYDLHPGAPTPRAIPVAGRPYGENRAGVVFGLITHQTEKYPDGMERVILLSDPLKGLGSLAEPECARIMAAIDLAAERSVPVEWVPVSSGAHIAMDSGTENLDWTAAVLRKIIEFTQSGGEINVIVDAINVGAQSYFNAEATMLMHTKGVLIQTPRGAMVLTGKKALDYSGGVSAEDERGIGGFERVMGPNGQAQYFARHLGHAFELLFAHYDFTYKKAGEDRPRPFATKDPAERDAMLAPYPTPDEGFTKVGDVFSATHNGERKKPFGMRALMDAVMDQDGGSLERSAFMRDAEIAVVRDCHLGGEPVCLIGVESRQIPRLGYVPGDGPETWTGGTFFPQSSKKVARAINAASGNRPVVVLANLSGFDGSPESMRKWQLEYGAEIGRAVVNFKGPIIFCVVARYHGGAYVVFSKALNPNLKALALEGSYASVIGGAPAAAVVFSGQVKAEAEKDERVKAARKRRDSAPADEQPTLREEYARVYAEVHAEKQSELAKAFDRIHSVERACQVGSLDEVLAASTLRQRLAELVRREVPSQSATVPPKVVLPATAPALRLSTPQITTPPITALPSSKN
jgi:acetyl-CoA carboxylase carboxyltransferase component/biotin carboxyl carrier protein